jgi:hypothetical protein
VGCRRHGGNLAEAAARSYEVRMGKQGSASWIELD